MALPPLRSMNGSLAEGMTEGGHKRKNRDRGGFVERTTEIARENLYDTNYSIAEHPYPTRADETQTTWESEDRYRSRNKPGSPEYTSPLRHC